MNFQHAGAGAGGDDSIDNSLNSTNASEAEVSDTQLARFEHYGESIMEQWSSGNLVSGLGSTAMYDLRMILSVLDYVSIIQKLPSSILGTFDCDWSAYTLGRIVNEIEGGNGVKTLCSYFLAGMLEASYNNDTKAVVAVLHGLVGWLYLNYDVSQSVE